MTGPARIILLDDHPAILDGVASFLEGFPDLEVVARYSQADAALAGLKAHCPDVAVVDIKVGAGFTFEFCEKARRACPELRLIFITGHDDAVLVKKAFEVGGNGFVLKSEPLTELINAIREAQKGGRYLSTETERRSLGFACEGRVGAARLALLTPREREILKHVSSGLSAKEISRCLGISAWTVTNHKANIMAKLGIHNQVGLARFALETGLANL